MPFNGLLETNNLTLTYRLYSSLVRQILGNFLFNKIPGVKKNTAFFLGIKYLGANLTLEISPNSTKLSVSSLDDSWRLVLNDGKYNITLAPGITGEVISIIRLILKGHLYIVIHDVTFPANEGRFLNRNREMCENFISSEDCTLINYAN